MKQLFRVVFVIYSVYFFSMAFMNYANILQMKFESNSLQVEIEKPEDLTNTEYIYLLKEICKKAKADILYKMVQNKKLVIILRIYLERILMRN